MGAGVSPGGMDREFGDYELMEEIARGGMGVVYRARQRSLGREVAIKMMLGGQFASREAVDRFRAEASAAARLRHPGIISPHEVGEREGQHYFSMELVEGPDLAALTREQPLVSERAARYVQQAAEAIQYAHDRGILHRDLKPSNVLIDAFDQPRITDFGLAKQLRDDPQLTLSGELLGSPGYLAPEQASGRRGGIGAGADVYGLGAILYHLLTGRAPFVAGSAAEALQAVLHDEPVPPRRLNPSVPRDLETVTLKCLEKVPARRYATAEALAQDLGCFLAGRPIAARPIGPGGRAWRWCRRYPVVTGLLATVILLLLALAFGSTAAAVRIGKAERLATEKLRESYLDQARARRVSGRAGQRHDSLLALQSAAALDPSPSLRFELRNEATACLALPDARWVGERPGMPTGRLEWMCFSPGLDRYARAEADGRLVVRRASDDSEITAVPVKPPGLYWIHAFSPNGRWLALSPDITWIEVWDLERRERRIRTRNGAGYCDLSRDSRRVAISHEMSGVGIFDLDSGTLERQLDCGVVSGYLRFDPEGRRLAVFIHDPPHIEILDVASGKPLRSLAQANPVTELRWDDSGRRLAAAGEAGVGTVWDVESGERQLTLSGHDSRMMRIAFSHNGRWLVSSGWDEIVRFWDAESGRPLLQIPGIAYQLIFSADDRRLAFGQWDDHVRMLELAWPAALRGYLSEAPATGPFQPSFSADGRWVANPSSAGVRVWDTAEADGPVAVVPELKCRSAVFSPDGSALWTSGSRGLARWPLSRAGGDGGGRLRVGEREPLPWPGSFMQLTPPAADGWMAVASRDHGETTVFQWSKPADAVRLGPQTGVQCVALSPDARWVATAPWGGKSILIWNRPSTQLVSRLPLGSVPQATVEFSPDGRWLVTGGDEYRLWQTGTWQPGPAISVPRKNSPLGYATFSPDSRTLAVIHAGHEVWLFGVATGMALATMETPTQVRLAWPRFSPDGSRLACAGARGEVWLWDLQLLRKELAAMQLDW